MELKDGDVNVVQQLGVELDSVAGGEENNNLLLQVLLQKGEEEQEPFSRGAHNVTWTKT